MSKPKEKVLFVAKQDTSTKLSLKDRIVQAAKAQNKKKRDDDNILDDVEEHDNSPAVARNKVLTEEEEWEQFVQNAEQRKQNRVAAGTTNTDASEYEDELAYVRRMILSSRFSTKHLIS